MATAMWLAKRLEAVPSEGAVPLVSLRLAVAAAEALEAPQGVATHLARGISPFIEDGVVDGKRLMRVSLAIVANRSAVLSGRDLADAAAEASKDDHWAVLQVTDVLSAGWSKSGKHMWDVWCTHLWGPMSGRSYMMKASDNYLCGVVKDVSGAKWSSAVAPVDLSLMRMRVLMKGDGIKYIDKKWSSGRKWNSDIRRAREGCSRFPCEKCGMDRSTCPVSPCSIKKGIDNGK